MTKRAVFGLLIACIISTAVAFVFYDKTAVTFARWFVGSFVLQFIIQHIITVVLDARVGLKIKQYEARSLEAYRKTFQSVPCPCFIKNVQLIHMDFNSPTTYTCEKCNKQLTAHADIVSVLATVPTDNDKALKENLSKINEEIEQNERPTEID